MPTKHDKPGYLGPAFHEWLEWLEWCEAVANGKHPKHKRNYYTVNQTLTEISDEFMPEITSLMIPHETALAKLVRSSVKYRVTMNTLSDVVTLYSDELDYIEKTRPIRLPHPACTLIVDMNGRDTFLMCCAETTTTSGADYSELGVSGDETWLCIDPAFWRSTGVDTMDSGHSRMFHCPVEIHMQNGRLKKDTKTLLAIPKHVTATDKGQHTFWMLAGVVNIWICSMHLSSVIRRQVAGLPPRFAGDTPRKFRKKNKHPKFEHVVIELPVNHQQGDTTGRSILQSRKRLHPVRGFFRHYQSGKTAWVKPHWRGDKKLGVIRKDYEITIEENKP